MKKKKKPVTLKINPLITILVLVGLVFIFLTGILIGMSVDLVFDTAEKRGETAKVDEKEKKESTKKVTALTERKTTKAAAEKIEEESTKGRDNETESTKIIEERKKISKGRIAFVIDDVGYNLRQLQPFLKIPGELTFAVLPKLEYTEEAVTAIKKAGKQFILHQPMEPMGEENPGPGALYTDMDLKEIEQVLTENLSIFPEIHGLNNHMGSKATADNDFMKNFFILLKERNLFFLDSLTTPYSVAGKMADEMKVQYVRRSIFLDNEDNREYIESAIEKGLALAEKKTDVVMIGHVWSDYLSSVINDYMGVIEKEGYSLVSLEDFFKDN